MFDQFNSLLAAKKKSVSGWLDAKRTSQDVLSRDFQQLSGQIGSQSLSPIETPWELGQQQRLVYLPDARPAHDAPDPLDAAHDATDPVDAAHDPAVPHHPGHVAAAPHDPYKLDIKTIRPLNYDSTFIDVRRMFAPLSASDEEGVAQDERARREEAEGVCASLSKRKQAAHLAELEETLSCERDALLCERIEDADDIDRGTIFVGLDPGQQYALAGVFYPPADLPNKVPLAITVKSSAIQSLDREAQDVQVLWQQQSHLRKLLTILEQGE